VDLKSLGAGCFNFVDLRGDSFHFVVFTFCIRFL